MKVKVNAFSAFQDTTDPKYMAFSTDTDMGSLIRIGEGEIDLTLFSQTQIVKNSVEALENEIKQTRAQSEAKVTGLQRRIAELQSLEWSGE